MLGPSSKIDWEEIKTFLEVMRCGTVRTTARELGIHHSTVSRRIENLEKTMAVRLFDRRPEGYSPTSAGEELATAARLFSDNLGDVERHITGLDQMLTGRVVVTMAEPLAANIIAPRLPEFAEQYPGLELELIASYELLDVARRQADIAVRMDNNPPDTLVGKRLFPYYSAIYAAPEYLAKHDLINEPEKARWLGWESDNHRYPEWIRDTPYADVPVWGSLGNLTVQANATIAGLGIAMLPCMLGDQTEGLVRLPKSKPQPTRDIWILTHADLRRTARIRAFMDFAEGALRDQKAAFFGELGNQAAA